jgi:hypothetical protein
VAIARSADGNPYHIQTRSVHIGRPYQGGKRTNSSFGTVTRLLLCVFHLWFILKHVMPLMAFRLLYQLLSTGSLSLIVYISALTSPHYVRRYAALGQPSQWKIGIHRDSWNVLGG